MKSTLSYKSRKMSRAKVFSSVACCAIASLLVASPPHIQTLDQDLSQFGRQDVRLDFPDDVKSWIGFQGINVSADRSKIALFCNARVERFNHQFALQMSLLRAYPSQVEPNRVFNVYRYRNFLVVDSSHLKFPFIGSDAHHSHSNLYDALGVWTNMKRNVLGWVINNKAFNHYDVNTLENQDDQYRRFQLNLNDAASKTGNLKNVLFAVIEKKYNADTDLVFPNSPLFAGENCSIVLAGVNASNHLIVVCISLSKTDYYDVESIANLAGKYSDQFESLPLQSSPNLTNEMDLEKTPNQSSPGLSWTY